MARLGSTVDIKQRTGDWRVDFEAERVELERLESVNDSLPEGEVVGALLRYQRGDGYAYYVVTKASPLTVSWVRFGDGWTVEDTLIRGLRKSDVLAEIARQRRFREVFGRTA